MIRPSFAIALVLPLLLAACGHVQEKKKVQELDRQVKKYVQLIRWGEFRAANGMIRRRDGKPNEVDVSKFNYLRVTKYDQQAATLPGDTNQALMTAIFEYYYEDSAKVRRLVQQGTWWYDDVEGRWFLDGELPDFPR